MPKFKLMIPLTGEQKDDLLMSLKFLGSIERKILRICKSKEGSLLHVQKTDALIEMLTGLEKVSKVLCKLGDQGGWGQYVEDNETRRRTIETCNNLIARLRTEIDENPE